MTLAEKYGFRAILLPGDGPIVRLFFARHLKELGYPENTQPQGQVWIGIARGDQVYCVFGVAQEPNGKFNVSDFYTWPGRWGKLAAYVAIEEIKLTADARKLSLVVMSRIENEPMNRAIERTFGDIATHLVYQYNM